MKVTTIGLDIAKQVFQVHGVDEWGEVVLLGNTGVTSSPRMNNLHGNDI